MKDLTYPTWFTGPKGESQIFQSAAEVPAGWTSGAEKQTISGKPAPPPKPAPAGTAPSPPSPPSPPKAAKATAELDAHGHPWSAELHSATKSKTKAGLWRMGVGKPRPDPAPGFPALDL